MSTPTTYLVTGGAGFIGSNFLDVLVADDEPKKIVVLDDLTYCGNLNSIYGHIEQGCVEFVKGDIASIHPLEYLIEEYKPDYIINFAAETHVDRSVDDPLPFVRTNISGVFNILELLRRSTHRVKCFLQVSTDEVYGDLDIGEYTLGHENQIKLLGREYYMYGDDAFKESTPLHASSPYSASKASADLLALSYHRTFGVPVIVTRCSNNYGPRQFPEKLIPLMINNILNGKELPVYGEGKNVRDWIYVGDHARGVLSALRHGRAGEVYNFGGYSERRNIDIVKLLIDMVRSQVQDNKNVSERYPLAAEASERMIKYVSDRPGHDRRYAIDASKAMTELGWRPTTTFEQGMAATVRWYLDNLDWVKDVVDGEYRHYYQRMYQNR